MDVHAALLCIKVLLRMSCRRLPRKCITSRLAQLVERKTLNLVVVGSSPTVGGCLIFFVEAGRYVWISETEKLDACVFLQNVYRL